MTTPGKKRNPVRYTKHLSEARFTLLLVLFVGLVFIAVPSSPPGIRELGIALMTTGVLSLFYDIMLRNSFLDEMREQLAKSLASEFSILNRIDEAGLIDIYQTFPTSEVANAFRTASEIRIMQTWIPDLVTMLKPLKYASTQGCNVMILLLDPNSDLAHVRAKDLGYSDTRIVSDKIRDNLHEIARFCQTEEITLNFEVRLHDTTPSVCIHSYDDISVVGFYLNKTPAIQNPQFITRGNTSYFSIAIHEHFSRVWATAKKYEGMF
jgi:hypothetical protein